MDFIFFSECNKILLKKLRILIISQSCLCPKKIQSYSSPTVNELIFNFEIVSECLDQLKRLLHVYRSINGTFNEFSNWLYVYLMSHELKTYLDKDHSWREIRLERPIHRRHGPWLSISEYGLNAISDCHRTVTQIGLEIL